MSFMSQASQVNFQHHIINVASLTVEKTTTRTSAYPTLTFEIREPLDSQKRFNNTTKWALQLNPSTELPELIATLLTYKQKCSFTFHSDTKNHALHVEWLPAEEMLKFTFLFAGKNRYIKMPRAKVFELAAFASDAMIASLISRQIVTNSNITINDVENYIARVYRPFKAARQS